MAGAGGLRGWLADRASAVAAVASGLLAAVERLRGEAAGRELAELASRQELVEMLLGGFEPEAEEPYARRSLARLYMVLYGVHVSTPRRLALRLRDGLPLSIAGRGVVVEAGSTRFLRMVEAALREAEALLEGLGAEGRGQVGFDVSDPLWGLEAARRLAEEAVKTLPPYSGEALALYAASAPAPLGAAAALLGSGAAGELEELVEAVERLVGHEAPGEEGRLRILLRPGGLLRGYRCLANRLMRLLQLEELREFVEAPDPLEEMLGEALEAVDAKLAGRLRGASEGHGSPRLPAPEGCRSEAEDPALPAGAAAYQGRLLIEDVEVKRPDTGETLATYGELVRGMLPLLYRGLAGLEPLERSGERLLVKWWAVLPRAP